jgi:hypothetical protein
VWGGLHGVDKRFPGDAAFEATELLGGDDLARKPSRSKKKLPGDVSDRPPEADELSNAGEVTAPVQTRVTTLTGLFVLAGENMT